MSRPAHGCSVVCSPAALVLAVCLAGCSPNVAIPVGGACTMDDACLTGLCIPAVDEHGEPTAWVEGYCSGHCSDAPCPQGSCLALADGSSYCVATCAADADCRPGYVCAPAASACLPDCRSGWSCGTALACNPENGNCEPAANGA